MTCKLIALIAAWTTDNMAISTSRRLNCVHLSIACISAKNSEYSVFRQRTPASAPSFIIEPSINNLIAIEFWARRKSRSYQRNQHIPRFNPVLLLLPLTPICRSLFLLVMISIFLPQTKQLYRWSTASLCSHSFNAGSRGYRIFYRESLRQIISFLVAFAAIFSTYLPQTSLISSMTNFFFILNFLLLVNYITVLYSSSFPARQYDTVHSLFLTFLRTYLWNKCQCAKIASMSKNAHFLRL